MTQIMTFERQPELELNRPFLSKSEYVYQLLKTKIVNGYLERNQIHTIVEIAEKLGVSRTPVGEAVKILASQNYIILYQGVGFKVKELNIEDIRENLTISGALEKAVLKKIVKEGTTTTEKLEQAVEKSWQAVENQSPELYTSTSADFHKAFYALASLPRITEILRENVFVHEIWYREGACQYPEGIKRLIMDHENIIKIIQYQNYSQIGDVIDIHVENCEEVLLKVIQN
jgi:DNA-binding GntR family transcriptional regulator